MAPPRSNMHNQPLTLNTKQTTSNSALTQHHYAKNLIFFISASIPA